MQSFPQLEEIKWGSDRPQINRRGGGGTLASRKKRERQMGGGKGRRCSGLRAIRCFGRKKGTVEKKKISSAYVSRGSAVREGQRRGEGGPSKGKRRGFGPGHRKRFTVL